jgi:hypothetical protein
VKIDHFLPQFKPHLNLLDGYFENRPNYHVSTRRGEWTLRYWHSRTGGRTKTQSHIAFDRRLRHFHNRTWRPCWHKIILAGRSKYALSNRPRCLTARHDHWTCDVICLRARLLILKASVEISSKPEVCGVRARAKWAKNNEKLLKFILENWLKHCQSRR